MPAAGTDQLAAARAAQPLWSLVPLEARARYIRRAAVALLDELDDLAVRLAVETGWPRTQLELTELLPAASGLRAIADDGPRALADQRIAPLAARLVGRSTRLVHSPVGVIGLRGPSASPFAEPALEAAAALLAGNGVIWAGATPVAAQRLRAVFLRAGVPGELFTTADELGDVCRRVVDLPPAGRRGTLLVVNGAPRERVLEAALWAGFGRHPAAAGRLVVTPGSAHGLVEELRLRAAQLTVGDPRDPETAIGTYADASPVAEVVAVSADDPRFTHPPDAPILAVVEAPDTETAIAITARGARDGPVSIWARDPAQGERVARRLPSPSTWVGRHGIAGTAVPTRMARHVVVRQLEWRAAWAPGTPALPLDEDLLATQRSLTVLRHGRESRRWPALREGAHALVRTAKRER